MNNMFDVINSIDTGQAKDAVVEELSNPVFYLGPKPVVLKLISKMITLGFIEEKDEFLFVTEKGREFYSKIDELDV